MGKNKYKIVTDEFGGEFYDYKDYEKLLKNLDPDDNKVFSASDISEFYDMFMLEIEGLMFDISGDCDTQRLQDISNTIQIFMLLLLDKIGKKEV